MRSITVHTRALLSRCLFSWAALSLAMVASGTQAQAQVREGTLAPELELRTLTGAPFKLSALRRSPVVITFWGTWCPPCRSEFTELSAVYTKYRATGLQIVAVNQGDQERKVSDVHAFVDALAVPFTVVLDPRGRSRPTYRLVGLPTTVFVDTAGVVRKVLSGPVSPESLAGGLATIGVVR